MIRKSDTSSQVLSLNKQPLAGTLGRKNELSGKINQNSVMKLLENIGFELVMQYNESRTKVQSAIQKRAEF